VTGSIGQNSLKAGQQFQKGRASWYGPGFLGRRTASGERFNAGAMTAAHRSLPFGTRVRVVNESNGQSVVVRINDRGPFASGRIIDLAPGPAQTLGLTSSGTAYVSLQRLD
jgi:rare lipoprotein A